MGGLTTGCTAIWPFPPFHLKSWVQPSNVEGALSQLSIEEGGEKIYCRMVLGW